MTPVSEYETKGPMTGDLHHRGHHVDERYLFEGITQFVVREHGDGLVSGRGSHASALAARAEIDRCNLDGSVEGCALRERADITEREIASRQ